MKKVTWKDEADFVKAMIDRDLNTISMWGDKGRYIKDIAEYLNVKMSEVESEAESYVEDLAQRPTKMTELMDPIDWLQTGECYKNDEALKWLFDSPYCHDYDHIHVYEGGYVVAFPDHTDDVIWLSFDGIHKQGHILDVMEDVYAEYVTTILEKNNENL